MMDQVAKSDCFRVVYSDGGVFYTRAKSATEYIFEPTFIRFILLCVVLFSALMLAVDVPFLAQLILFGAGILSSFFWLAITISLYHSILLWMGSRTIFTPILLLPMQVMNSLTIEFVLRQFGTSHTDGFNSFWEISLRTVIIIISMDIIHGRFVAPQHGTHVAEADLVDAGTTPSGPAVRDAAAAAARPMDPTIRDRQTPSTASATAPPAEAAPVMLKIGNTMFDLRTVRSIKSEDHYLVVQETHGSSMVRGKLRDIAADIDVTWGLQVNRSIWIAYTAIEAVNETPNGHMEILMGDDTVIRVSESRRVFFVHNYDQFLNSSESVRPSDEADPTD